MLNILIVEDMEERIDAYRKYFKNHCITVARSYDQAIRWLGKEEFDLIQLDHDLAEEHYNDMSLAHTYDKTGHSVAKWMVENGSNKDASVVVHSWNLVGAENIYQTLMADDRDVIKLPFGQERGVDGSKEFFD